jgi:hypothetical protein
MDHKRLIGGILCLLGLAAPPSAKATIAVEVFGSATIPVVPARMSYAYSFDQGPFTTFSGFTVPNAFTQDFPLYWSGPGANEIFYAFLGTTTLNNQSVDLTSTAFSTFLNTSGSFVGANFVGFLGIDSNGNATAATVAPTRVADIFANPTSGPPVVVGYIEADFGSTKPNDTTFTVVNTSGADFDNQLNGQGSTPLAPVPEPSSFVLMLAGGLVPTVWSWRRWRRPVAPAIGSSS